MLLLPSRAALQFNRVYHSDALLLCSALEAQSVDLFFTDMPYNTTACEWETEIDLDAFWYQVKRIIKPTTPVILTGSQPFTSKLVMSNPRMFRYEWIWEKTQGTGYLNANRNPMKSHENILIFYETLGTYTPQMERGKSYRATRGAVGGFVHDKTVGGYQTVNEGLRYPKTVLRFKSETGYHPTQKPVPMLEYLINTYSCKGDLVVDPFSGSGTTAIAARNTGRNFICGDSSAEYVAVARKRLAQPFTIPMMLETA